MPRQRGDHPNVIVFFTDQQRWDSTGVHGNPLDLTPSLDRMAQWGTHAYYACTCQPVCAPARAVLQTGQYQNQNGVFCNRVPLREDAKTLAHYFRGGGYTTGYIGKWHLGGQEPVTEPRRGGYQYWLGSNALEFTSDAYSTVMYDNDNQRVFLPGYRVDAQTDAAIRYIDQQPHAPFFLFLPYIEPHFQHHLADSPPPDCFQ